MEKINSTQQVSSREFISSALSIYFEKQFSFALWRLPDSPLFHLTASEHPRKASDINLEELKPGFLFSPFHPAKEKIHLPADEFYTFEFDRLISGLGKHSDEIQFSKKQRVPNQHSRSPYYTSVNHHPTSTAEKDFHKLVVKCRDEILRGNFEKIVPSRTKTIQLPADFDLVDTFHRLCQLYPHAMVSIFSSPLTGTWVGATPEMLVSISRDQHFHTVALAGTQPYEEGTDLRTVTWTQKDIEEQALVERYVISCFKKIRLREYNEQGPRTAIAGNVLHLKTDFDVDMTATNFPQLGSIMLQLLHPTSAVCGMPLEASLLFLEDNEGYDRQFYSGYLGPVNVQQESHIYVNLRCMQLFADQAILYAGAGVMSESDPEKEWKETEMKMSTLDRIIRK